MGGERSQKHCNSIHTSALPSDHEPLLPDPAQAWWGTLQWVTRSVSWRVIVVAADQRWKGLWSSHRERRCHESAWRPAPLPLQSNLAGCWYVRSWTNNESAIVNNNVCARSLSWGQSSVHKAHLASITCPEILFSTSVFILPGFSAELLSGCSIHNVG